MSSKVKSGAEKRRLKETELYEKAGTNPKQKSVPMFSEKFNSTQRIKKIYFIAI